jgi:ADP-ribosylglycohydrolase
MGSKANGALMRITPLAVWGHKLSQHDLVQAVMSDAQLTHPNKTCLVSHVVYSTLSTRLPDVMQTACTHAGVCPMMSRRHCTCVNIVEAIASCQLTKAVLPIV